MSKAGAVWETTLSPDPPDLQTHPLCAIIRCLKFLKLLKFSANYIM